MGVNLFYCTAGVGHKLRMMSSSIYLLTTQTRVKLVSDWHSSNRHHGWLHGKFN